jgi:hypothetical protein
MDHPARFKVHMTPADITWFWFDETAPAQWWCAGAAFDALLLATLAGELHAGGHCGRPDGPGPDARGRGRRP